MNGSSFLLNRFLWMQFAKAALCGLCLWLPVQECGALAEKGAEVKISSSTAQGEPLFQLAARSRSGGKKTSLQGKRSPKAVGNELTSDKGRKLLHHDFKVTPGLQGAVDFWKMVYTKYDRNFEIVHDTEDLSIVYSVLDCSDLASKNDLGNEGRRLARKTRIEAEKDRLRQILNKLAETEYELSALSREEKRIYDLFKNNGNPKKFKDALAEGRIRSQTGIRDHFVSGLVVSTAYLEEMEDIFAQQGLPAELTRLAFVESMFNLKARSKVGASGIWQFMPATGRLYLNIDAAVDERNDPLRATQAAARLLKSNYEALGTWPLAINAYNSGRATMQRAVAASGTRDIEAIIRSYRGGVYGFASRNFYPSFLAALEVSNHYSAYFGKLALAAPQSYESYETRHPLKLPDFARAAGLRWESFVELNPHFTEAALAGTQPVPAAYRLRIPPGKQAACAQAEFKLAEAAKASAKPAPRRKR